jgi:hypothetical protein
MPKFEPPPRRHHLRVWLKSAVESGLFDRLPPQYEPDDFSGPQPTDEYARRLMAELRDPDSSRPQSEVVRDAERFRRWVEARQKESRRIILSQSEASAACDSVAEDEAWVAALSEKIVRRVNSHGRATGVDPMWDEFLDG